MKPNYQRYPRHPRLFGYFVTFMQMFAADRPADSPFWQLSFRGMPANPQ
jgi:hypothetical protein